MGCYDDFSLKPEPCSGPVKPEPNNSGLNTTQTAKDELPLLDSVAMETASQGTPIEYYSLSIEGSTIDPLYIEPINRAFTLFNLMGVVEWPDSTPEMLEGGARTRFQNTITIPRRAFELAGAPAPSEGDAVRFWMTPFFDDFSVDGANVPNAGFYFDVIDVDDDGHPYDGPEFIWFKLSCKRTTDFTPERRILDE